MAKKCLRLEIIESVEKPLGSNWRLTQFLWKPKAEHYDGIVVLTLPFKKVKSVIVCDINGKKIKTLTYRPHRPTDPNEKPVGDAWADYSTTGAEYQKNYPKGILIKVTYTDKKVRTFKLTCPKNRSDGK